MRISVEIPDTVSTQAEPRYYQEALVAMLYQAGDLSSKEACDALDMPRRAFEEMLARFDVSIMPDDDENIAAELNA